METKVCIVCNQEKELSEFTFRKDINKYRNQCKECRNRQFRESDKYVSALERCHKYYRENRTQILEHAKKYQKENSKTIKEKKRERYLKNKDAVIKKVFEYHNNKLKTDKVYKVRATIHTLVNKYFKKRGFKKTLKVKDIIGCSYKELTNHLEQTFKDNYGYDYNGEPVHIDHIIPAYTANNSEELTKLFHYSNLQYLKPNDNFCKNKRLNWRVNANV